VKFDLRSNNLPNSLISALRRQCEKTPDACALTGALHTLSYQGLASAIEQVGVQLSVIPFKTLGLALDNSPLWAVLDLAGLSSGKVVVPLPFFFSAEQVAHSIRDAGIGCILTDQPDLYEKILTDSGIEVDSSYTHIISGQEVTEFRLLNVTDKVLPEGTVKVTYTSGTTGHPKGVCLGADSLYLVARSLLTATLGRPGDQHASVLPLSTLLENLAGVYVPLLAGATCHLLPLATVGLSGSSGLDVQKMLGTLIQCRATTTILTPQLLHALIAAMEAGHPKPEHLRFVAIGGASVSERLLQRAEALGLPVFEGYGLSECNSVVSLNTPHARRIGSVGKPLPHVALKFTDEGEIQVSGATLLGYIGDAVVPSGEFWSTGDIGYLDDEGFLHLSGRKKNIFITSFGRNVSPEWVERELTLHPAIAQAAVFGEARPYNVAVIVPRGNVPEAAINQAIAEANLVLPDYAQVKSWIAAATPFLPQNGQLTANGRLKRDAILAQYQTAIDKFYL
jgi:long-subunit acyl-CoA synthetase (AMP-forming)